MDTGEVLAGLWLGGLDARDVRVLDDRRGAPIFRARVSDTPVVIRYRGPGAATAFEVLQALWSGPLGPTERGLPAGMPRPIAVLPTSGLVVTEYVAGPPAGRRGVPVGPELTGLAVALSARLQRTPVTDAWPVIDQQHLLTSLWHAVTELVARDEVAAGRLGVVVALLERLPAPPDPLVASHGDLSPHHVLLGSAGPVLIDVDRAHRAPAGRDLAHWAAWDWATQLVAGLDPEWRAAVPGGIPRPQRCDAVGVRSGYAHRAAALVRIVHGWPVLRPPRAAPARRRIIAEALRLARAATD
ncbi:MAG: phosphotransferase [Kineosporiaceae bacterium]